MLGEGRGRWAVSQNPKFIRLITVKPIQWPPEKFALKNTKVREECMSSSTFLPTISFDIPGKQLKITQS